MEVRFFDAHGTLWHFELNVIEDEEIEDEKEYVEELVSEVTGGQDLSVNSDLDQAMSDLRSLDEEKRSVAVRFVANNRTLFDDILSSFENDLFGLDLASADPILRSSIHAEVNEDIVRALIVLEMGRIPSGDMDSSMMGENAMWELDQDPCRELLGGTWRVPSVVEWENFIEQGPLMTPHLESAFESEMKLHAGGFLQPNGELAAKGVRGAYYSRTQTRLQSAWILSMFSANNLDLNRVTTGKNASFNIRCIEGDGDPEEIELHMDVSATSGLIGDEIMLDASASFATQGSELEFL